MPAGEPNSAQDQGRRGRDTSAQPPPGRQTQGRRREQEGAAYPPEARSAPQQRHGVMRPSDDLAWPDAQPVDADWQPATPRPRDPPGRDTPTASRRPDRYGGGGDRQATYGDSPSRSAWSGGPPEPDEPWLDDLAYDADPASDQAAHLGDPREPGYATGADAEWPDDPSPAEATRLDDPDAVDSSWDQGQEPSNAWTGVEQANEPVYDDLVGEDPRSAVFGSPERPTRHSSGPRDGFRPPVWGLSGYAWRFARKLTIPRTNRLLRFGASRVLPASSRARFTEMGLPPVEVDETLGQIRSLDDWAEAWTGTAQRFLGETRRGGDLTPTDAARSRQLAALCYHVAGFFAFGDERLARTSRSASTTLFAQSLGLLMPETRQVNVRWRSRTMPGYLTVPSWATGRRPLAVLMNGATTSREELILWSDEFLAQGLAVLALDTPGFGEGSALGTVALDNDDITDGIFELAESDPGLDPTKVSLVGISLGGTMALRAAAQERRVSAVVAVTPSYEPARWLGASSPVSLAQMVPLFGGYDQLADFVLGLDMPTTVEAIQAQVLIFGAGHDLVVPAPEASRLAAALGEQATLVWFDDAGHALFDVVPEWTREAAEWLAVVMDVSDAPIFAEPDQDETPEEPPSSDHGPFEASGVVESTTAGNRSQRGAVSEPTFQATARPTMASRPTPPPTPGQQPAVERPVPVMARPPEPEPYGTDVFDAAQAEARRAGQQRGYETGVFGPLGPAAARILADEPTPQPGSPEWGYDDVDQWTGQAAGSPFDQDSARPAPSTSRLWRPSEPPASQAATEFRPVMAQPVDRPGDQSLADQPVDDQPHGPEPPGANYLLPSSPAVGRGRTSEPFRTAPPVEPDQAAPSFATPVLARTSRPAVDRTDVAPETPRLAPNNASSPESPGDAEQEAALVDRGSSATANEVSQDEDSHAPFRPPFDPTD
jgi:dienelactone hydrolase